MSCSQQTQSGFISSAAIEEYISNEKVCVWSRALNQSPFYKTFTRTIAERLFSAPANLCNVVALGKEPLKLPGGALCGEP